MIILRAAQMQAFEKAALTPFEDEMVRHSQTFSPHLAEVLGEEQLRVALRQTMERAVGYGFTNRGPMRLMVEMMFLFGSGFDSDPQYLWAEEGLRGSGEQMDRADKLCQRVIDYQRRVGGTEGANTRNAVTELVEAMRKPLSFTPEDFASGMLGELRRIFPQKAVHVGDSALRELVQKGRRLGRQHGFPPSLGEALLVRMMFFFGYDCIRDPLYPWIGQTLADEKIVDATARVQSLEKKVNTWLEQVLARLKAQTPT